VATAREKESLSLRVKQLEGELTQLLPYKKLKAAMDEVFQEHLKNIDPPAASFSPGVDVNYDTWLERFDKQPEARKALAFLIRRRGMKFSKSELGLPTSRRTPTTNRSAKT
jgi:hypothetical protein